MGSGHFPLKAYYCVTYTKSIEIYGYGRDNFLPLMKTYASKLEFYNVRYDEHDSLVSDKNVFFGGLGDKNSECVG
jgi:hypothetical protein